MTEAARQEQPGTQAPAEPEVTAGRMLRRAREARGLHIAAFAAAMKIPQRKVEALEADRYDDLPDAAFTRALAKSACRSLKIDPAPVLALLPQPDADRLDQVSAGLNTPFREGRRPIFEGLNWMRSPTLWIVVLLALGAALMYFWPAAPVPVPATSSVDALPRLVETPVPLEIPGSAVMVQPTLTHEPEASAAGGALVARTDGLALAAPARADAPLQPDPVPAGPAASRLLMLTVTADSWVEIVDGNQRSLVSRVVRPGEPIGLDGALPMRVTIGNVGATTLRLRGVEVNLAAAARGNVARVELR